MTGCIKFILNKLVKGYQPKINSYFLLMVTILITIISLFFAMQSIIDVHEVYEERVEYGAG